MADKQQLALVMMNAAEAQKVRDEIISDAASHYARQRARLLDFYNREGWRALGYKNWTECVEKEFSDSRRRIFQLLEESKIVEEIKLALGDKAPAISGQAARALASVPVGKRAEALQDAQAEHGATPSGAKVKKSVDKWKTSGAGKNGTKKKKKEKVLTIGEQAESSEKLHQALMVIGDTCNRNFRKAIEDGTVEMSKAEVMAMADLEDDRMQEVEKLISVNRWPLKRALKFLDKQPELTDSIETLTHLALASLDDEWTGDFGAFSITVRVHRRKLDK